MAKKDDKPARATPGKGLDGPLRIVDKGNFTEARCECGWRGAARRSRKKAREDAAAHLEERCKAFKRK